MDINSTCCLTFILFSNLIYTQIYAYSLVSFWMFTYDWCDWKHKVSKVSVLTFVNTSYEPVTCWENNSLFSKAPAVREESAYRIKSDFFPETCHSKKAFSEISINQPEMNPNHIHPLKAIFSGPV